VLPTVPIHLVVLSDRVPLAASNLVNLGLGSWKKKRALRQKSGVVWLSLMHFV